MITRVTITGADDSIQPRDLLTLQQEFPFVEWGILLSRTSQGQTRFPSFDWLLTLRHFKQAEGNSLALSAHLCGAWVREILFGKHEFIQELTPSVWNMFDRVQINTHAQRHSYNEQAIGLLNTLGNKEFIFQYDNVNTELPKLAREYEVNHSALFDLSHGIGKLPLAWPDLLSGTKCGYAGGLSPDNLKQQIERIEGKAGDTPIWIDMETHVRSNNDEQFDLAKVRQCLEIASEYVQVSA